MSEISAAAILAAELLRQGKIQPEHLEAEFLKIARLVRATGAILHPKGEKKQNHGGRGGPDRNTQSAGKPKP